MQTLRYIRRHPLNRERPTAAIWRLVAWQARSRLARRPLVVPFVDDTRLFLSRGMTGATGNVYCGLHEFHEMALVMHAMRPGDLFLDVGANVGSYTILASGVAGAQAIAIEPVPSTHAALRANVDGNALGERVDCVPMAIGDHEGRVNFTVDRDSMNHVARSGERGATIEVAMTTLDALCANRKPSLVKVDVEGHEASVLRGAHGVLRDSSLRAAIVEVWDESRDEVEHTMLRFGFTALAYDPGTRRLSQSEVPALSNVLYVRDHEWLAARCESAPSRLVQAVGTFV
jgi:FkbM family methyltransferase